MQRLIFISSASSQRRSHRKQHHFSQLGSCAPRISVISVIGVHTAVSQLSIGVGSELQGKSE